MQDRFNVKRIVSHTLLLTAGLLLVLPLSGCVAEKNVSGQQALVAQPILNEQLVKDDFDFPSQPPQLSKGKVVFQQNCATCHTGAMSADKIKGSRPIDTYLMLTRGDKGHPSFTKLSRDERWAAIFYARYLTGGTQYMTHTRAEIASIFGSNCAVCHGTKGRADGPLYTGHASAHELGMAPVKNAFNPPPADFSNYPRMYNRTDEQLFKFIAEGVYPSAMPSWLGRKDVAKNATFDDALIRDLVKYVREFSYQNDLPEEEASKPTPPQASKELSQSSTPGVSGKLETR